MTVTRFADVRRPPTPQQRANALIVGRCGNGGKFQYASRRDAKRATKLLPAHRHARAYE